jgi:hypothetical protein
VAALLVTSFMVIKGFNVHGTSEQRLAKLSYSCASFAAAHRPRRNMSPRASRDDHGRKWLSRMVNSHHRHIKCFFEVNWRAQSNMTHTALTARAQPPERFQMTDSAHAKQSKFTLAFAAKFTCSARVKRLSAEMKDL